MLIKNYPHSRHRNRSQQTRGEDLARSSAHILVRYQIFQVWKEDHIDYQDRDLESLRAREFVTGGFQHIRESRCLLFDPMNIGLINHINEHVAKELLPLLAIRRITSEDCAEVNGQTFVLAELHRPPQMILVKDSDKKLHDQSL